MKISGVDGLFFEGEEVTVRRERGADKSVNDDG